MVATYTTWRPAILADQRVTSTASRAVTGDEVVKRGPVLARQPIKPIAIPRQQAEFDRLINLAGTRRDQYKVAQEFAELAYKAVGLPLEKYSANAPCYDGCINALSGLSLAKYDPSTVTLFQACVKAHNQARVRDVLAAMQKYDLEHILTRLQILGGPEALLDALKQIGDVLTEATDLKVLAKEAYNCAAWHRERGKCMLSQADIAMAEKYTAYARTVSSWAN